MKNKIHNFIKPYVRENKISQKDYNYLFGSFDEEMLDLVHSTLEYLEIEIVTELSSKNPLFDLNKLERIEMNNEQLCLLYQQGEEAGLDALIVKNKSLVYSRVVKYSRIYTHDLSEDDLFQEGCMGMMKAAKRFDINRAKFTTYAVYWIDQAITRAIADTGYAIRVPVHMYEKVNKLRKVAREIETLNLDNWEIEKEIMNRTDFNSDELKQVIGIAEYILKPSSLNIAIGESKDIELIELLEFEDNFNPVEMMIDSEMRKDLSDILDSLTEREANVIKLRFGLNNGKDKTLEEVGQIYGVTRERIRQIEAKALRRLRHPSKAKKLRGYLYDE